MKKMVFSLFKSKNWRETPQKFRFPLYSTNQKLFWPFLGIFQKYYIPFNFKFSYLGSLRFLKMRTLPLVQCVQRNLLIFWNWPPKNTPDQQKRVAFWKSQKVQNHSTLVDRACLVSLSGQAWAGFYTAKIIYFWLRLHLGPLFWLRLQLQP